MRSLTPRFWMTWGLAWQGAGHEVRVKSSVTSLLFGVARNVAAIQGSDVGNVSTVEHEDGPVDVAEGVPPANDL